MASRLVRRRVHRGGEALAMAVAGDGTIAVGGYGRRVTLWSPDGVRRVARVDVRATVRAICFLGDERLAIVTREGRVHVVARRAAGGADGWAGASVAYAFDAHASLVDCAGSGGGGTLLTGARDGSVGVWAVGAEGAERSGTLEAGAAVYAVCAAGDARGGQYLVAALADGDVVLWEAGAAGAGRRRGLRLRAASALAPLGADAGVDAGACVAVGGADGYVALLHVPDLGIVWEDTLPTPWLTALAFGRAPGQAGTPGLVAAAADGSVRLLDPEVGDTVAALASASGSGGEGEAGVVAAAVAEAGTVTVLHRDGQLSFWNPERADPWTLVAWFGARPGLPADVRAAALACSAGRTLEPLRPWLVEPAEGGDPYRAVAALGATGADLLARLRRVAVRAARRG